MTCNFKEEQLTSLERIRLYSNGKEVDRLPYKLNLGESIVPHYGYSNKEYLFSSEIMVDVTEKVLNEYGGDGLGFTLDTRMFSEAMGSQLEYKEYGYSYITQHKIKNIEEIKKLEPINISEVGRFKIVLEALERLLERYAKEQPFSISVPCPANCALGIIKLEDLLRIMIKKPEDFFYLMDYCFDIVIDAVKMFYQHTSVPVNIFEVTASAQVMGEKQYLKYIHPYIVKMIHSITAITGTMPSFGGCGSNKYIWKHLTDVGIRSFGIDSSDDIGVAKTELGNSSSISGNIDPVLLLTGNRELIKREMYHCIKTASDNPCGYTITLGGAPASFGTSQENLNTFVNYAKKYGTIAKKGRLSEGIMNAQLYEENL